MNGDLYTTTATIPEPQPISLDDVAKAFEEEFAKPYPLGTLYGMPVYLLRSSRDLKIGNLIFPVDHPYARQTPMWSEAKRILNEQV